MRTGTICFAMLIGIAKPMPVFEPERVIIWASIPMTRPCLSSNGPPELPGFIGASVCMTLGNEKWESLVRIVRPMALTMPVVVENSCPNGLPMVIAICPTRISLLSPRLTGFSSSASRSIFRTAKSESSSQPITSASASLPSEKTTVMRSASTTTCRFVTMCPASSHTNPEPCPFL